MSDKADTHGDAALTLPVTLLMPFDPATRSSIMEAMNGDGVLAYDRGGIMLRESVEPSSIIQLSINIGSDWLTAAIDFAVGVAGYASAKFVDGFAGDPIKELGAQSRKSVAAAARAMFSSLAKAIRRVREADLKRGVEFIISATAVTGEERLYFFPACDARRACIAIADDLLEPNTRFKQRHWIEGRWIDSSDLEGHGRREADEHRAIVPAVDALEHVTGDLAAYGPLTRREIDGTSDVLIDVPDGLRSAGLDDLLEALRARFPECRIGLDDRRGHIRVTDDRVFSNGSDPVED